MVVIEMFSYESFLNNWGDKEKDGIVTLIIIKHKII